MQLTVLLTLLPLLAAADQHPLMEKAAGWLDKAKAYMEGAVHSPVDAGAAKVADQLVTNITRGNWEHALAPQLQGPHEFLLYVTGSNKSCFGNCGRADEMWNLAVPQIAAMPSRPRLGSLNCEVEDIICTAWSANLPTIWHFSFPQKPASDSVPTPPTPLHIVPLNWTAVTADDIVAIVRDNSWREVPEYDGVLHPIDGAFRKYGVLMPFGWAMWGLGSTPSWLIMIAISFFSRQWMAKKAARSPGIGSAAPGAQGGAQAAPAAPAAGGAGAARGGGGKKKK